MALVIKKKDEQGNKPVVARNTALDPRNPSLVQPYKRLVDEGFITRLRVEFSPSGFTAEGVPDARMIAVPESNLMVGTAYPLGTLIAIADKGNLVPKKQKNKAAGGSAERAQPLPKKTLTLRDFDGTTNQQLLARAAVVASADSAGTLVGRVRSANKFTANVTTSFHDWWAAADVDSRATALCQSKELAKLTDVHKARLATMPCPFRGNAEFVVADEED